MEHHGLPTDCWNHVHLSAYKSVIHSILWVSPGLDRRQKKLHHPTRPVENVMIMTKGLQERKIQLLIGKTVKKVIKKKLILTEIFPSVHET